MKYTLSVFLTVVSATIFTTISGAFGASAQESCDCIVSEAGSLDNLAGIVHKSGVNGLSPAMTGTILDGGTQIIVGAGSATVNFGAGCELALLGANLELTVSRLETEQLCVRVTSHNVIQTEDAPEISPVSVLISGAMIGGMILVIDEGDSLSGGSSPASN